MTIKQQGGIFGRKPTFSKVDVEGSDASSFDRTGSLGKIVTFNDDGSEVGAIGTNGNVWFQGPSGTAGVEFANNVILPWRDGARANGSIALGSSSYKFNGGYFSNNLVMNSGNGIDFSATAGTGTSELFDDYEEGTFTPTVFGATTAGTTVYNSQLGHYTKIGNTVTAHISIGVTSATGTGAIRIGGLPFVQNANVSGTFPVATNNVNWTGGTYLAGIFFETTTNLRIFGIVDNGGWVEQNIANATVIWRISVVYQV